MTGECLMTITLDEENMRRIHNKEAWEDIKEVEVGNRSDIPVIRPPPPHRSATFLNQAPAVGVGGQGFLSGQLSLSHRTGTGTEKPGFVDSLNQPQSK
ncbi:hypothetical protein G5714_016534 [Onychostoma macrolepis]|uniref:Uncharacterized protein n=1 Tax=Onychostoma macrolepis TaxID=369639 RepID=A0A7J6C9D0_9TELE|nr:hypothetical protein G5714_016534 [Onychostoma macrolepis]